MLTAQQRQCIIGAWKGNKNIGCREAAEAAQCGHATAARLLKRLKEGKEQSASEERNASRLAVVERVQDSGVPASQREVRYGIVTKSATKVRKMRLKEIAEAVTKEVHPMRKRVISKRTVQRLLKPVVRCRP